MTGEGIGGWLPKAAPLTPSSPPEDSQTAPPAFGFKMQTKDRASLLKQIFNADLSFCQLWGKETVQSQCNI